MGMTGLILGALKGAGNSVADGAADYQKMKDMEAAQSQRMADEERMARLRSDLQVEASKRVAEANSKVEREPLDRYAALVQQKMQEEIPAEIPDITELSGADPDSEYRTADGSPTVGLRGNYEELMAQVLRIPDLEARALGVEQLKRQYQTEVDSAQSKAGLRTLSRDEAHEAAMRELRITDLQAYEAAKKITADKQTVLGPNSAVWSEQQGKVLFQNEQGEVMANAKSASDMRKAEKQIEARERAASIKNEMAASKTAINPKDVESAAAGLAFYQEKPLGERIRGSPWGIAVMNRVRELNPEWDGKRYGEMDKGIKSFATGKQGDAVRSFNVAIDHIGTLEGLVDALNNNDIRAINELGNIIGAQTGNTAPTNFDAVKNIVADEIVKAVVGGAAALADREKMADNIRTSNSPEQMNGVIDQWKALMRGQLDGLHDQYTRTTGRDDFYENMLSPAARKVAITGHQSQKPAPRIAMPPAAVPAAVAPPVQPVKAVNPDDGWGNLRIGGG